jgi:hypothetical protein
MWIMLMLFKIKDSENGWVIKILHYFLLVYITTVENSVMSQVENGTYLCTLFPVSAEVYPRLCMTADLACC